MADLDFDELDKAVNSLMKDVGKSTIPEGTGDEAVRTVTLPSHEDAPASAMSVETAPVVAPASATPSPLPTQAAPVAKPSVATRRGGRFMDVVPPATGLRTMAPPAKPISRQGMVIQPSASFAPTEPTPVAETPVAAEPTTPAASEVPAAAAHSDWPDPIDMHEAASSADVAPTEPADIPTSEPVAEPEPVSAPAQEPAEPAPLTSPFLADAKVEKRPLGGVSTPEPTTDAKPDTVLEPRLDDAVATSEDQAEKDTDTKQPDEIVQPLPPELQGDLVAIEAGSGTVTPEERSDEPADPKPAATAAAGATSIPQQYKEEPSTGDKENGAIYDTETYHQPLAHPAKKKSGWLWIVWIVLILILGAGAGAAVYFLKLI